MKTEALSDVLSGLVFVALATALTRQPNTARDISAAGEAYSRSIRAATGLEPAPTPDEMAERAAARFVADPDGEVADLEAELNRVFGIDSTGRRARNHRTMIDRLRGPRVGPNREPWDR